MASCLPLQLPSQSPLHAAHDTSSCTKFAGRTSQIDAALLIANLNANNIKLLLCTIDHTLVAWVTFCTASCTAPTLPTPATFPIPPKPPWLVPNDFPHSPAFFAFQRSLHAPHSLLPLASRAWHAQTKKTHRFGSSRSTASPAQWATQQLSLNTSLALTTHLSTALSAILPSHPPPSTLPGPSFHLPFTLPYSSSTT